MCCLLISKGNVPLKLRRKDTDCCTISIFFCKKAPHLFAVRAVAIGAGRLA